jgi:hypothetical protein
MFKKTCENKVLLEKIGDVIERVENFKTDNDEKRLSMTLHLIELVTELKGGDNE